MSSNPRADAAARTYKSISQDYAFNPSIFCEDEQRVRLVKYIVDNVLAPADRIIILLYAEEQSFRKLGARLGLSHSTIRNEVIRIKRIILAEYEKLKEHDIH